MLDFDKREFNQITRMIEFMRIHLFAASRKILVDDIR